MVHGLFYPTQSLLPSKEVPPSHVNQAIELAAFNPPSSSQQATELSEQLCPVQALKAYVGATAIFRKPDKLFVCYGGCKDLNVEIG